MVIQKLRNIWNKCSIFASHWWEIYALSELLKDFLGRFRLYLSVATWLFTYCVPAIKTSITAFCWESHLNIACNYLVSTGLMGVLHFISIDCIALVKQRGNTFGSICVSDRLSVCMHCQGWTICSTTLIFCWSPNIDWYFLAECQ